MLDFSKLDEFELVSIYSNSVKELRKRESFAQIMLSGN